MARVKAKPKLIDWKANHKCNYYCKSDVHCAVSAFTPGKLTREECDAAIMAKIECELVSTYRVYEVMNMTGKACITERGQSKFSVDGTEEYWLMFFREVSKS